MTDLIISAQNKAAESEVFSEISQCIDNSENFVFDAGAGAGKTYCLRRLNFTKTLKPRCLLKWSVKLWNSTVK